MAVSVSAIIPAYREADVIAHTVEAALGISGVTEVVVVDDGSPDDTSEMARAAGAHRVVTLDRNRGKGAALSRGLESSTGEVLLLLDADLGSSASEGEKLLVPVLSGEADMAIAVLSGSRPSSAEGDPDVLRPRSGGFGLVVKAARLGIKLLTGRVMQAPLAGPRAVRREVIQRVGGFAERFGVEVGLTIDALRYGFKVVEVPVNMVHRASGRDVKGFIHRGRQMLDVLRTLVGRAACI